MVKTEKGLEHAPNLSKRKEMIVKYKLLNVENLAETGHVEYILNQRLKVTYN
jgi:hypothetical protein